MYKARTINEFKKIDNNEQIQQLILRHEEIKKELKKYFNFLQYKHFSDMSKEEQENYVHNEEKERLCNIVNNIFNELAELTQFMGNSDEKEEQ